jgi:hypothetical protein
MSESPTGLTSQDLEHLRLLALFHYIVGAITAITMSFPLIHVTIGLVLLFDPQFFGPDKQHAPVRLVGLVFVLIGGAIVLFGWTLGGVTIYVGRCIRRRERYVFCLVVSCINCLQMPFGTILGVLTLIVLLRDPVKELFQPGRSSAPPYSSTG